jgi:hypothetical protein
MRQKSEYTLRVFCRPVAYITPCTATHADTEVHVSLEARNVGSARRHIKSAKNMLRRRRRSDDKGKGAASTSLAIEIGRLCSRTRPRRKQTETCDPTKNAQRKLFPSWLKQFIYPTTFRFNQHPGSCKGAQLTDNCCTFRCQHLPRRNIVNLLHKYGWSKRVGKEGLPSHALCKQSEMGSSYSEAGESLLWS